MHMPPAPAPVADEITTAAPFAVATPARFEASMAGTVRPRGALPIAVAVGALLAIGAATWWVASRDAHPATVVLPTSAVAKPASSANAPHGSASEVPPTSAAAPTPEPDPSPASVGPTTNAPDPAVAPVLNARAPAPAPAPGPAGVLPPRPKHAPIRHGYDPQGI
jgi:hypothetical protein